MGKGLFITGTGTDIGKTFVTGLIIKKLASSGLNAAYYKAAMSGNVRDEKGALIPGDAKWVKDVSEISQPLEEMCPYVYQVAVSPHLAAKIENNPITMDVIEAGYRNAINKYDYVTVEGSGGIVCPISYDTDSTSKILLEDIVKAVGTNSVIIADAGLGTINSVVLTCEYMKNRNLPVKGIIFNNWSGGIMQEDNLKMCQKLTGVKVIAKVCKGDTELDIDIGELVDLYR